MVDEFNALMANDTKELVPYNFAHNILASKCVHRIKYKSDGSIAVQSSSNCRKKSSAGKY